MAEPEIALVFSAEPWVEALHRYCSDHGGARVRQLLVDPVLALDEEYATLVSGHRWPALTPALGRPSCIVMGAPCSASGTAPNRRVVYF